HLRRAAAHRRGPHGRGRGRVRAGRPDGMTGRPDGTAGRGVTTDATDLRLVELRVGGMTCAACAARVEKKLNRLAGVTATVNFATGTAHVRAPAGVSVDDLVRTVEATGYTATLPPPEEAGEGDEPPAERVLRTRLVVNALLTAPLLVLTMVPTTQFRYWQWVALALATPVVTW